MARYIDADALIKEMKECKYANPCNDYQRGVNASIDIQITGIKHIPGADVVPRSEGEWKFHRDGSGTCSECHFTQRRVWDYDNHQRFCGVCGAKMKGGK